MIIIVTVCLPPFPHHQTGTGGGTSLSLCLCLSPPWTGWTVGRLPLPWLVVILLPVPCTLPALFAGWLGQSLPVLLSLHCHNCLRHVLLASTSNPPLPLPPTCLPKLLPAVCFLPPFAAPAFPYLPPSLDILLGHGSQLLLLPTPPLLPALPHTTTSDYPTPCHLCICMPCCLSHPSPDMATSCCTCCPGWAGSGVGKVPHVLKNIPFPLAFLPSHFPHLQLPCPHRCAVLPNTCNRHGMAGH